MSVDLGNITSVLPPMLMGEDLISAMASLPEYDPNIIHGETTTRLLALGDLYRVYLPTSMSVEIYGKIYTALIRSLQKKGTKLSIIQQNENRKKTIGLESQGIIGGADSFSIIGSSGLGKSIAIQRAVSLITKNEVIVTENPFCKVIPCLTVQCPFDCSVKGLLLEILRNVDVSIGTRYYESAIRGRYTSDMLIGSVSQVALNHIGMLIVDEIQNVVNSRNGRSLVGMLTQMINSSGISICMVGTPESATFFEQAMQLARRSLGLTYKALPFDGFFCQACQVFFSYQCVKKAIPLTESVYNWLYEHTQGIIALLVSVIHDAQEIAIINGTETLDMTALEVAYRQRLTMMHGFLNVEPLVANGKKRRLVKNIDCDSSTKTGDTASFVNDGTISELVELAKKDKIPITQLLKENDLLEEVAV